MASINIIWKQPWSINSAIMENCLIWLLIIFSLVNRLNLIYSKHNLLFCFFPYLQMIKLLNWKWPKRSSCPTHPPSSAGFTIISLIDDYSAFVSKHPVKGKKRAKLFHWLKVLIVKKFFLMSNLYLHPWHFMPLILVLSFGEECSGIYLEEVRISPNPLPYSGVWIQLSSLLLAFFSAI